VEIDTTLETNKDFPFYYTIYERGCVKGCAKNANISCKECVCRSFCICKEGL
jgi:hypothetical protein